MERIDKGINPNKNPVNKTSKKDTPASDNAVIDENSRFLDNRKKDKIAISIKPTNVPPLIKTLYRWPPNNASSTAPHKSEIKPPRNK